MSKALIGFFCLFLAVASAQNQCLQSLETAYPVIMQMYTDASAKNWTNLELDTEKMLPLTRSLMLDCLNYQVPDSPRIESCIKDSENIIHLALPVIMDPTNQAALYSLLFQLPGQLSSFYSECVNAPAKTKSDNEYVTVLLEQKDLEGDIYNCISSLYPMVPLFKKLAVDYVQGADQKTIQRDLSGIVLVWNSVRASCGFSRAESFLKPSDMEQCMTHVMKIYTIIEGIIASNYDTVTLIEGITQIAEDIPAALLACNIGK